MTATPPGSREDDCRDCEGWDEVDSDGRCPHCAGSLANDPWEVVHWDGNVDGPMSRDAAEAIARRLSHTGYGGQPCTARRVA